MLKDLLLKYNRPGPRYTSYPPANFFSGDFGTGDYKDALVQSNQEHPENISLYFHVPFCPQICHFCGCNTDELLANSRVEIYFRALLKELDYVGKFLSKERKVTQIHWGGGTPNSVAIRHIEEVMTRVKTMFTLDSAAEIAMECSPAYLSKAYLTKLHNLGFNRISLGVQDFDPKVLEAVNRKEPRYPIEEIVADIRELGFVGVNLDLIYGLPLQTVESFADAVAKAIQIKPDRLVTFSYAHVPWVKPAQKSLEEYGLPTPNQKLDMLVSGYNLMKKAGYTAIGMDHFALPTDSMAIAKNNKLLHRNFQGYCTQETTGQVYAFGSTGITQLEGAYIQNARNTSEYIRSVNKTGMAVERGYKLNRDEKTIRKTINSVMCNGKLNFEELASELNLSVEEWKTICQFDANKLSEFTEDNLLTFSDNEIMVSENGMMVVRNIAMAFDPNLEESSNLYSKTI